MRKGAHRSARMIHSRASEGRKTTDLACTSVCLVTPRDVFPRSRVGLALAGAGADDCLRWKLNKQVGQRTALQGFPTGDGNGYLLAPSPGVPFVVGRFGKRSFENNGAR